MATKTPADVLALAESSGVKVVDVRFIDLPGTWQHFSIPVGELTEKTFSEGLMFDGSSIRGFQAINESDMLLMPDPTTALVDPILKVPTLSIVCDVWDPIENVPYSRDPRNIAKKAEAYLKSTGIADTTYWGPEAEFYIFDSIAFDQNSHSGYYFIDSREGIWNSGNEGGNLANRPRLKQGYFPTPPLDSFQDLRSEIMLAMIEAGIDVEIQHHEVGGPGQAEIDIRFDTLTREADKLILYKYIVKNVCAQHGFVATFMPKPIFQDNGSGMHCHQSLWKDGTNLFFEAGTYASLSQLARWYVGGILAHAPALLAFVAPTVNSYRRLVPGYEAPINLVYSARNRSAAVRIPVTPDSNPKAKRIEFRCPDPTANPYLAFPAMLMAGLDGIKKRIEPPAPIDKDIYELEGEEKAGIAHVPGSLQESLDALEADHDFLLEGDVFTKDVIENWIGLKRQEVDAVALRPHPWEFYLYHDA